VGRRRYVIPRGGGTLEKSWIQKKDKRKMSVVVRENCKRIVAAFLSLKEFFYVFMLIDIH